MEKTKTSLYGPQESFNVPFEQLISFKCHKNNFCWIGILDIKGVIAISTCLRNESQILHLLEISVSEPHCTQACHHNSDSFQ